MRQELAKCEVPYSSRADAGFQRGFAGVLGEVLRIQLLQQIELPPLLGGGHAVALDVRQHLANVQVGMIDVGPLIFAGEKAAGPKLGKPHGTPRTEDHVTGQILRLAAEAVQHPRAEAGAGRRDGAVVHQEQGGAVVGVVGVHRADDAEVVDVPGRVRQQLADRQAALAAGLKLVRHRHAAAGGIFRAEIDFLRPLPRELVESRLGIEKVPLKRPAVHEELNDPFGTGLKMGLEFGSGGFGLFVCQGSISGQELGEAAHSQAAAEGLEGLAAGEGDIDLWGGCFHLSRSHARQSVGDSCWPTLWRAWLPF